MFDTDEIVDELLENNEELEDILDERTTDLVDALWLVVDTQSELLDVYRSCLEGDGEYLEEEVRDKPVMN